jgi:hypothetical protein
MLPSASHFSGAQNCVSHGGTFNNILGDYIAVAESSDPGLYISPWSLFTRILFQSLFSI